MEAEHLAGRRRGGLCHGGGSGKRAAAPAGRLLTYRTLQLQFQLDAEHLEALTDELIKGQRLAADEDGTVLVWIGDVASPPASAAVVPTRAPRAYPV